MLLCKSGKNVTISEREAWMNQDDQNFVQALLEAKTAELSCTNFMIGLYLVLYMKNI